MADIIVLVPKDQLDHFWGDKAHAPQAFWNFRSKPQKLRQGEDYIWFAAASGIIAGAPVYMLTDEELDGTDDPQGRWKVVWESAAEMRPLDPPLMGLPVTTRGFRYATDTEQIVLRARYDQAREAAPDKS